MADGKPIRYAASDINNKSQLVPNGKWDGLLHVIEPRVTMDISYRLAQLIRENGWTIKITHYSQKWIDNVIQTTSSNQNAPWLLDEMEYYDTWWDGTQERFVWSNNKEGARIVRKRRVAMIKDMVSWSDPKDTFFLSIHADSQVHTRLDGVTYRYQANKNGTNSGQKLFTENLAHASQTIRWTAVINKPQDLYILRDASSIPNSTLVELGNMNNSGTAYTLRNPEKRQEYAQGIFRWLHTLATRPKIEKKEIAQR